MEVKAIMCDIDGTLLTTEGTVSPLTADAIRQVRDKGVLFGISTGRAVTNVRKLLPEWGLSDMVDAIVGSGGAEIYDFALDHYEENYPLPGHVIRDIIDHYKDMDVNFVIHGDGFLYVPKDNANIRNLSASDKIPYKVIDFDEYLKTSHPKVMIACAPEMMDAVTKRGKTFKSGDFRSASLQTTKLLYEFMDPRITKTYGLKKIMDLHGFSLEDLCVFGDADNDYDMVLNAGVGVAMANGSEKTKNAADYITDDNDHNGIGNFIFEHILS